MHLNKPVNKWGWLLCDENGLSCNFGKPKSSESDYPIKNRWTIMSDSKFSSGVAFLTMLKFAYFWLLGVHLGSYRGPLRDRFLHNMIFGMSFDSLMPSTRKINGSKKSQSLGSDIKCHITLKSILRIFDTQNLTQPMKFLLRTSIGPLFVGLNRGGGG